MSTAPLIRTQQDIEQIESTPLSDRDLPSSTYELIRRTALAHPEAAALSFLLQGTAEETPLRLNYAELLGKITHTANACHRLGLRPG